jgi:hypothetical protein
MLLPLYVCRKCGRYGGIGLAMSQDFARVAKGEKTKNDEACPPECPDGHGRMYEVQENDRLTVLSAIVDAAQITPPTSA